MPTFSMPSLVKPVRDAISLILKQLYRLSPWLWWVKPSNWVPTCPSSVVTSSSLLPRWFDCGFMNVRLVCTLNWRVACSGMPCLSTWPSSMTSPVRTSFVAAITDAGFMWLADPRSSPAPHLEGQRSLSAGGFQVCAPTRGDTNRNTAAVAAMADRLAFMVFSLGVMRDGWSCGMPQDCPQHNTREPAGRPDAPQPDSVVRTAVRACGAGTLRGSSSGMRRRYVRSVYCPRLSGGSDIRASSGGAPAALLLLLQRKIELAEILQLLHPRELLEQPLRLLPVFVRGELQEFVAQLVVRERHGRRALEIVPLRCQLLAVLHFQRDAAGLRQVTR